MMDEFIKVLNYHGRVYPGMEIEDVEKLLYQHVMGGGHLIEDEGAFVARLQAEMNLPGLFTAEPLKPDPVGNGLFRLHLSALEKGPAARTLAALCSRAAAGHSGDIQQLQELAGKVREQLAPVWQAAAGNALERWDAWMADGCPQPHHSQRFTRLYNPHYRLLQKETALFLPLFAAIDAALAQRPHVLVGIDGMAAAGKSTLAALLKVVYGCGVVHADDFFLQPHQRTQGRLAQPGGNVDYERLAPVAAMAADDRAFSYQAYDCQREELGEWRSVPAGRLTLLEGAYSLHPQVNAACDIRVFCALAAAQQAARVQRRNGPQLAERFIREWIPMENLYFTEYDVRQGCDLVFETDELSDGEL